MPKIKPLALPYALTVSGLLLYYAMLATMLALMLSRKSTFWHEMPFAAMHTWGSHISNLAITCLLYVTIGMFWTLQGVQPKILVWLGIVFAMLNLIVELFVPVLNTRDAVDALFGVAGVLLGGLCLYGLRNMKRELKH